MNNTASQSWRSALFQFFRSIKLAITLLIIIVVTSILATLIPQNNEAGFYSAAYGKVMSWLILSTGYDNFFKSFIFIVPAALFFVNLAVCTYNRLIGRLKRGVKKRFGPDILHIGLLILIIGGMITFIGKETASINLAVDDRVDLTGGYTLTLKSFEFLKYEDGRPKDWISTVQLKKDNEIIQESFPIEVNNPLRAGSKRIYQYTYSVRNILYISDPDGSIYKLSPGQIIPVGEDGMVFRNVTYDPGGQGEYIALFEKWTGHNVKERVNLKVSDKIDIYTITGIDSQMTTGLLVVNDPGYYIVFIGLILLTIGLFLTYYQKLGDNKI